MLLLTSAKAATFAVDILLILGCVLVIACIKGAATDNDRPRFPDKVNERWFDK